MIDLGQLIAGFRKLDERQQVLVLARFAHELTVLARETCVPGTDQINNAAMMRSVNELQHRVTAATVERLCNDQKRYPDEVLVRLCADPTDSPAAASAGPGFARMLTEFRGESPTH